MPGAKVIKRKKNSMTKKNNSALNKPKKKSSLYKKLYNKTFGTGGARTA